MQLIMRMKMGNVLNRQNSDQRTEKNRPSPKQGPKIAYKGKLGLCGK